MSVIDRLTTELSRLPGVGTKTALRLAYHLMKGSPDDARRLARAIGDVVERIRPCSRCGNFSEEVLCPVCSDPRRDGSLICVVEEAYEVGAIERTGRYRGMYHVLGGRLSPLDGIGPEELRVAALVDRIKGGRADSTEDRRVDVGGAGSDDVREVIVATNSGVEGEATAVYLENLIRPLGPRVTRLARGIPVGSDLEYVDGNTLAEALSGRREM